MRPSCKRPDEVFWPYSVNTMITSGGYYAERPVGLSGPTGWDNQGCGGAIMLYDKVIENGGMGHPALRGKCE